jgi:hypothetical protein
LTGLDPKYTKAESISPFEFLRMVCFIGLPLYIGILATPTPFLYIFLVVHTIIIPTYWVSWDVLALPRNNLREHSKGL